jgi:hypothetical protein
MKKITTVITQEFDKNGILLKHTVVTTEEEIVDVNPNIYPTIIPNTTPTIYPYPYPTITYGIKEE